MTQEKLEFDNVSFKIDHEGDLEIAIDAGERDGYAWLKSDEIEKLKYFLIQVTNGR